MIKPHITYHENFIQGSEEWHAARCGLLTASTMKLIITPAKLEYAKNDKSRSHVYELLAQRITNYTEPSYIGSDMLRGQADEIHARAKYAEKYSPVSEVGFVTNNKWGFTLGFSPDGLVGADGIIETKSRCQKYQVETIVSGEVPQEYMLQIQTGLLVCERSWCDFITYSGGLPMYTIRVRQDHTTQDAILKAAARFEEEIEVARKIYDSRLASSTERLTPTERTIEEEITL